MSIASRALAPGKPGKVVDSTRMVAAAKPAAVDAARGAIRLFNNGRWESLPFCAYAAVVFVVVAFRTVAGTDSERFVAVIFGVLALAALGGFVASFAYKADARTMLACACVTVASSWLAGAFGAPLSLGMFLIGLIVTAGLGVPYWVHLAKHRKPEVPTYVSVEQKAKEEPVDEFADVKGLQGSRWESRERPTPSGTFRPLRIARGLDARTVIETKTGAIAGLLDAPYDDVEIVETERASVVNVYNHTRNLLAEPQAWPYLNAPTWDILKDIKLGKLRTGEDDVINLHGKHLLIGGESGSGKSTLVRALAIIATMDPNCDVYLIDGKRVELSFWQHAAKMYVGDQLSDAIRTLNVIQDEMTRRYDLMAANKWLEFTESNGRIGPMVLFLDELPHFLRDSGTSKAKGEVKDEFVNKLMDLLDRGRACGLIVIATAIQPSAAQFKNGDLRAGFTLRVAFRMAPGASPMILGPGAGVDASKLPQKLRGMAYLSTGDGVARAFRAFWIDPATVKHYAELAPAEPYPIGTVLPAAIEAVPTATDDDWRLTLREMLDDTPKSMADLIGALPVGREPIRKELKTLEASGALVCETDGRKQLWRSK